jgi:hypothetical protein
MNWGEATDYLADNMNYDKMLYVLDRISQRNFGCDFEDTIDNHKAYCMQEGLEFMMSGFYKWLDKRKGEK